MNFLKTSLSKSYRGNMRWADRASDLQGTECVSFQIYSAYQTAGEKTHGRVSKAAAHGTSGTALQSNGVFEG